MPQKIDRRTFLRLAGLGSGAFALGCGGPVPLAAPGSTSTPTAPAPTEPDRRRAAPVADRALLVIEMAGGNDGLSTAGPLGRDRGRLHDLRPTIAHDEGELLVVDDGLGLHPALTRLHARGVAVFDGVGSSRPDESHFEMQRRWWAGDDRGDAGSATGFLGRLCDALDVGAPVTGLSIGGASTPALLAERAGTLGLPDPGWLWWLDDGDGDEWTAAFRHGLEGMAEADDSDPVGLALARRGLADGLRVGGLILDLPERSGYPESGLGEKLWLAARLLASGTGVRVVHVPMDGDFDSHESHRSSHDQLMGELDEAVDAFVTDLEAQGLADAVLVATTSEFGRRPEENDSAGLDHGTASAALVVGPVRPGRASESASLADLDENGNLTATTTLADYYGTLAESWFELPVSELLEGSPSPLADLVLG